MSEGLTKQLIGLLYVGNAMLVHAHDFLQVVNEHEAGIEGGLGVLKKFLLQLPEIFTQKIMVKG